MLELLLLRHAKSAWDQPGLDDHERDLAPRGVAAAKRMGRVLRDEGWRPDLVLCSTAIRARHTWDLAAAALGAEPEVKHLDGLYLASAGRLLEAIRRQPPACRRMLLIGHNPGMQALAVRLADDGQAEDLASLRAKLPTAALVRLAFTGDDWRAVGDGRGRLMQLIRPRELERPDAQ
jgi:phosphohistidine phosphatase